MPKDKQYNDQMKMYPKKKEREKRKTKQCYTKQQTEI